MYLFPNIRALKRKSADVQFTFWMGRGACFGRCRTRAGIQDSMLVRRRLISRGDDISISVTESSESVLLMLSPLV